MNGDPRSILLAAVLTAGLSVPSGNGLNTADVQPAPLQLAQTSATEVAAPSPSSETSGTVAEESQEQEPLPEAEPEVPVMKSGIPEGFEAYMAPQKTLIDVYFGGRLVTSSLVEYTPETIEFLNPEKVIRSLPNVAARPVLLNHIRGPLPTHGDRVCVRHAQQNCGTLQPDFIGVIFDERTFRADIFVHPDLMASADTTPASHLQEPKDSGVALVQNLSLNHSSNEIGDDRFSLFGRTLAGKGTQHLFSNWVRTDDQGLSVDELGARKDFPDHQVNAGLYEPETNLLTILPRQPIVGMGIKKSFQRRRDLDTAFATDIELFIANRSRVELIKDGRLYDARFYEAGNRKLDTSRLPSGAYNLAIRVTDSGGRTRTLSRFFVKTQRMAPGGDPVWFANLGRVQLRDPNDTLPKDGGTAQATAGVQYRLSEPLGIGAAGAAIEDAGLLELSANWLAPQWQTFVSLFTSTEGGAGWLTRANVHWEDATLVLDSQRVWNEAPDQGAEYVLLPDYVKRDSLEFRLPVKRGQLFTSWRRFQRNDASEQRTTTLGYTQTYTLAGSQSLSLNASVSRTNGENQALIGASWQFITPRWQHQAALNWRGGETPDESFSGRATSTWQDGNTFKDDVQISAGLESDGDRQVYSLDGNHTSQYGRGRASVSRSTGNDSPDNTLTSASIDTNLLVGKGALAAGGPELNQAGVIIDLRGADNAVFDVLVDGKKRFLARGGQRAALTLPGYENYRIAIRDRGTEFVHYDNNDRSVTLYPGNVEVLSWELQSVAIVLGKLVKPDNTPLGDAIIEGTRGVTSTDPDGYFQGEVTGNDTRLFSTVEGQRCQLRTGAINIENGVARLGRVTCEPVEVPTGGEAESTERTEPEPTPQ